MIHQYSITGMTCSNCVARVKNSLLLVKGVTSADVQLTSPQATINMSSEKSVSELQQAIGSHYIISDFIPA